MTTAETRKEKYIQEANAIGLTFITQTDSIGYGTYIKNSCGHTLKRRFTAVRKNEVCCDICLEDSFKKEAYSAGLTLIGKSELKDHKKYKSNTCGHLLDLRIINVRNKAFICQECQELRLSQEAHKHGLKLLCGKPVDKWGYRNYLLPCGCEKIIAISGVRNGYFSCHKHNRSSYNEKSMLYFINISTDDLSWVKIGITNNFKSRMGAIKFPKNVSITPIFILEFTNRHESTRYEQIIHKKFAEYNIPKDLLKDRYMYNGYTECYPESCKLNIQDFIKENVMQFSTYYIS